MSRGGHLRVHRARSSSPSGAATAGPGATVADAPARPGPLDLLRSAPLFSALGEDALALAASHLQLERFAAGETVVREGEPGDGWYLIREGMAAVVRSDLTGQAVTLAVLGPGESFGEAALAMQQPRAATVRAVTAVAAYVLGREAFRQLLDAHPEFGSLVRRRVDLLAIDTFLKRASLFARLPVEALWRLVPKLQPRRVRRGETIIRQGDAADCFYLVRSGRAEVRRGRRQLAVLQAGDAFGEVALLTGERRTATVRALEDTDVLALARPDFEAAVREHSVLRDHLREVVRIRFRPAPDQPLLAPDPVTTVMPFIVPRRRRRYWLVLLAGALAFALLTALAAQHPDPAVLYAALSVGSCVGPLVFVLYLADSSVLAARLRALALTAVLAAALGLPAAISLQRQVGAMPGSLAPALLIALIEETAKVLGIAWVLRRAPLRFAMDGVLYGAAAGMGFAALETLLYGLARVETVGVLLATLWLRALLSPFTHGTWTALVCAAIWRQRGAGLLRGGAGMLAALGLAVLLHGLWDWRPFPVPLNFAWLLLVGAGSILTLRYVVQQAGREEASAVLALNPEVGRGATGGRALRCAACRHAAPPGAHYCPRCGLALRLAARAA